MKRYSFVFTALVVSLIFGLSQAWAEWEDLNGPLNNDSATGTSLAEKDGTPFAAYSDPDVLGNGGIYVKSYDSGLDQWDLLGTNPLNSVGQYLSADAPSMAIDGDGSRYVAWSQKDTEPVTPEKKINVKWFAHDGTDWADKGTNPLNNNSANQANAPSLALASDGTPFAAWHEDNGSGVTQIFVKKHNGTDWELVGANPLNENGAHNAQLASIAVDGDGNPYAAWYEADNPEQVLPEDPVPVTQIFVKKFTPAETGWALVGTDNPLNKNYTNKAEAPRIVFNGTVPYLVWVEQDPANDLKKQVYVKSYDEVEDEWAFVGGDASLNYSVNRGASFPSIAFDGTGTPFVTWYEPSAAFEDTVFAKKLTPDKTGWTLVARLNMDDGRNAEAPEIAFDGVDGLAYISFMEEAPSDPFVYKVHVVKTTPTFVQMKAIEATPCAAPDVCITVAWETDMEPENAGFNVLRLVDLPGEEVYTQINPTFISALGTESTGDVYELVDSDVVEGQTYYYKVEDVNTNSQSTKNGPVVVIYSDCFDSDEDGYGDPASSNCTFPDPDCDDTDAGANPGAAELCDGEGIDEDCDGLVDNEDSDCSSYAAAANAEASTYGSGSVTGSGAFNELALLLVPLGAVAVLRIIRRRKR